MKKSYDCFYASGTRYEDGKIDSSEHPIVIVGNDEKYTYYFACSSDRKKEDPFSYDRIEYQENIEYEVLYNNHINTFLHRDKLDCGSVKTTYLKKMLNSKAKHLKRRFGYVTDSYVQSIIMKWFFQQNEIMPEFDESYKIICDMFHLTEKTKNSSEYKKLLEISESLSQETKWHREYEEERLLYNEIQERIIYYNSLAKDEPLSLNSVSYPTLPCASAFMIPLLTDSSASRVKRAVEWDKKNRPRFPYYQKKLEEVNEKIHNFKEVQEKK